MVASNARTGRITLCTLRHLISRSAAALVEKACRELYRCGSDVRARAIVIPVDAASPVYCARGQIRNPDFAVWESESTAEGPQLNSEPKSAITVLYLINHTAITSQLCRRCARGELTPTPSTQSLLEFSLNGQARTQTGRFIYPSG